MVDAEIEGLATSGGITADTRGNLSVETVLQIARWRSIQSATLYSQWAGQEYLTGLDADVALAASWEAAQSVDQYEAATERLSSNGVEPEPVEYELHGETLQFMANLAAPVARLTVGSLSHRSYGSPKTSRRRSSLREVPTHRRQASTGKRSCHRRRKPSHAGCSYSTDT